LLVWRSLPPSIEKALPPYTTYIHSFLYGSYKGYSSGNTYVFCWWVFLLLNNQIPFDWFHECIIFFFYGVRKVMLISFADPEDPSLRKLENSFLLGSILVYARFSFNSFTDKVLGDCRTSYVFIWLGFLWHYIFIFLLRFKIELIFITSRICEPSESNFCIYCSVAVFRK